MNYVQNISAKVWEIFQLISIKYRNNKTEISSFKCVYFKKFRN